MTAIVLQARLDSSRLPGKSLLLLDGKPLVFRVMEALNNVPCDIRVLACPEDSFKAFEPLAAAAGFQIHCGPKEDVLERYCQVIRRFNIDRVIRATADNPFVFADAAAAINAEAIEQNADYAGYGGLPLGAGVESVNAAALLEAASKSASEYDHEHVCPYLYNNEGAFKLHRRTAPPQWQGKNIRLTVDTQEDYQRAVKLYAALKNNSQRYQGHVIINTYIHINSR
jgi:spore coat polysaccharide biosynthesis protein SpsF